jgi:type IV secretory pathway VirB2 component (pilin)
MESFQLGPFTIRYVWLFLLTSLYLTYMVIDNLINREDSSKKSLFYNIVSNCFIIIVLTFKFSFLINRPSILWENPIGILYFTGGRMGWIVGIIIAFIYLGIQFKFNRLNEWRYWKLIVYGIVTFILSYYIVQTIFSLLI